MIKTFQLIKKIADLLTNKVIIKNINNIIDSVGNIYEEIKTLKLTSWANIGVTEDHGEPRENLIQYQK